MTNNLKIARKSLNLSQIDMSNKLEVSDKSYRRYESEGADIPGRVLAKLARMGFSVNWLLTGEGAMKEVPPISVIVDGEMVPIEFDPELGEASLYGGELFDDEIEDPGLIELLSPDNRGKFLISEEETQELLHIAFRRKSQTTLEQWVTILYTLRNLDK